MDDEGPAEGGRTRLARGTKPHVLASDREHAGSAAAQASVGSADGTSGAAGAPAPAGIDALGTGPVAVAAGGAADGASGSADHEPAQSICEAVERLIDAHEAEEAVAEWMRGGG